MKALNIEYAPHHAVYIGDEKADFMASQRVQEMLCIPMRFIAVTYGYMTRERLAALQPDALVDASREILSAIEKMFK